MVNRWGFRIKLLVTRLVPTIMLGNYTYHDDGSCSIKWNVVSYGLTLSLKVYVESGT